MFEYSLPERLLTDRDGYEALSELYSSLCLAENELCVRFDTCFEIHANLAAIMGALFDRLKHEGHTLFYRKPSSRSVRRKLARNHFLRALSIETDNTESCNYIDYRRFELDSALEFKQYIDEDLLQNKHFPLHTKGVAKRITENIFEMYVNALTHGCSNSVHCCGEITNDGKTFNMTIVDCGKTIPFNVNEYMSVRNNSILSHTDAIYWALQEGNTTKSDTGGIGFALLIEFIQLNEGRLQIVSGKGMLEYQNGIYNSLFLNNEFPGTIINMSFNLMDDKVYSLANEQKANIDINDLL